MKKTLSFFTILLLITSCKEHKKEKYANGNIKSDIPFEDSKRNGIAKYYYESGKLNTVLEYRQDTIVGETKEYYENGNIYREIDTKTSLAKIYLEDGKYYWKGHYDNNKQIMNGIWEHWNADENYKEGDRTFVNNEKSGPYTSFRKDGTIESKGFYNKDSLIDTLKIFDLKEQLQEIQTWKVDRNSGNSTLINDKFLTEIKPDGTVEHIGDKVYRWNNGKRELIADLHNKK